MKSHSAGKKGFGAFVSRQLMWLHKDNIARAAITHNWALVEEWLKVGADPDEFLLSSNPLHCAAAAKFPEQPEMVALLLESKASPNIFTRPAEHDRVPTRTPLHIAASVGSRTAFALLAMNEKTEYECKDGLGRTPLQLIPPNNPVYDVLQQTIEDRKKIDKLKQEALQHEAQAAAPVESTRKQEIANAIMKYNAIGDIFGSYSDRETKDINDDKNIIRNYYLKHAVFYYHKAFSLFKELHSEEAIVTEETIFTSEAHLENKIKKTNELILMKPGVKFVEGGTYSSPLFRSLQVFTGPLVFEQYLDRDLVIGGLRTEESLKKALMDSSEMEHREPDFFENPPPRISCELTSVELEGARRFHKASNVSRRSGIVSIHSDDSRFSVPSNLDSVSKTRKISPHSFSASSSDAQRSTAETQPLLTNGQSQKKTI